MPKTHALRSNLAIGFFVAGQLGFTFLTQAIVVLVLGPGIDTDSLIASQTLPTVAISIFSPALMALWQHRLAVAPEGEAHAVIRSAYGQGIMIAVAFMLVTMAVSMVATPWLFPGFSPDHLKLTVHLTLITSVGMAATLAAAINLAAGRAFGRLLALEAGSFAVIVLASIALYPLLGVFGAVGAAWLMAARAIIAFLVGWWVLGRPTPDFRLDADKRKVFADLRPIISAAALTKFGPVVERYWGSQGNAGDLTLYAFAQTGATAAASVVERSFVSATLGDISRAWDAGRLDIVRRQVSRCVKICWLLVLLGGLGLSVVASVWHLAAPLVPTVKPSDGWLVIQLVAIMLPQLATTATGTLFVSVCYASGDVRTPPRIAILVFVLGTIAKSVAFSIFGFHGLAAAGTLQLLLSSFLLHKTYSRNLQAAMLG